MTRRTRRSGAPAERSAGAPLPAGPSRLDAALEWAAPLVALLLVVRLAGFAAGARLTSDECFHAWMSEWIASHGALPATVDGLYGGFKYFYPPLLHLLGAGVVKLFGAPAFREVNVALLAALLAGAWFALSRAGARTAAAIAVLALAAWPGLVQQGVRMYVECLSAALAVGTTLALLATGRAPTRGRAVLLGALAGLGVLAKQSGLLALPVLGALAALALWRGRRAHAGAFALALAVACAVAAPFWVRNAALFGSPVYPMFGRDLDARLLELNVKGFTPGWRRFFAALLAQAGWVMPALLAVGLGVAAVARRTFAHLLLAGGALLLALAPLVPMLDSRHAIPLVAALVVLAAVAVAGALERAATARRLLLAVLVAIAGWGALATPNVREGLNLAGWMDETWAAIRANVPQDATILCIQTYDTFYYTGRGATWPIPWGQADPPVEMFDARDAATVLAALRRHRIAWLLVPTESRGTTFNSANFPNGFMLGLQQLSDQGAVDLVWGRRELVLLHVRE